MILTMPRKQRPHTERVTPEVLDERLSSALSDVAKKLDREIRDLREAIREGRIPQGYLPLILKTAEEKIDELDLFVDNDLAAKRRAAEKGMLRYRDKYLEEKREKYKENKKPQK
jgi:hypothetical protein